MPNAIAYLDESTASGWDRGLYAFLAEKHRRSGSTANRPGLFAHAPGVLRPRRQDAGSGYEPRRLRLGLRHRPLGQGAGAGHHRRPPRLPQ
jgi:hypothetical protein